MFKLNQITELNSRACFFLLLFLTHVNSFSGKSSHPNFDFAKFTENEYPHDDEFYIIKHPMGFLEAKFLENH